VGYSAEEEHLIRDHASPSQMPEGKKRVRREEGRRGCTLRRAAWQVLRRLNTDSHQVTSKSTPRPVPQRSDKRDWTRNLTPGLAKARRWKRSKRHQQGHGYAECGLSTQSLLCCLGTGLAYGSHSRAPGDHSFKYSSYHSSWGQQRPC
jgi:hypothetical protein